MRPTLTLLGLVLFTACSSSPSGNTPPPPPPPPPAAVATVTLNVPSAQVAEGATTTLVATARDAGGAAIAGKTIAWSTANAAIATVSSGGVVTGVVAGGPVNITATSEGKSATAAITVTPTPVNVVTVTPSNASLQVGATATLTATAKSASGTTLQGRTITWSSSAPTVATVANGVVTAVTPGNATITATSEGKSGTAAITVTAPPFAQFVSSDELRISNGVPVTAPVWGMAVAPDGSAVGITGAEVFDRSSTGTWGSTGTTIPGTPAMIATFADPSGGLWATGSNGVIVRKSGGSWVAENTGTSAAAFNAIAIRADGSGMAVGNPGGTVYYRSSTGVWTSGSAPVPGSTILNGVGSPTTNFALATGYGISGNGIGFGMRWDGSNWTAVTYPAANFVPYELIVVSPTEAYAIGIAGADLLAARYTILQWNGASWQVLMQRGVEVYPYPAGSTRCPDGTIYFGYKYGTIYRKPQAGSLSTFATDGQVASNGYDLVCDTDNSLVISADDGFVARHRNGAWTIERWVPNLNSVAIGSANTIVVAARAAVARFNGTTWTRTPIPYPPSTPVIIPVNVWAGGSDAAVSGTPPGRYTGGAWQWGPPFQHFGYSAVWGTSANQLFGVGGIDEIGIYQNGAWSVHTISLPGLNTFDQISGAGNFALAVAAFDDEGYQWDGASWSAFPSAPASSFGRIKVFSPTSIVSVGAGRTSLWNGTAWASMPGGNTAPSGIVALIGRSPTDLYAFTSGTIYHYNGTGWVTAGATGGTVRAAALEGNQAIAVGNGGLVLRATLP
jgi:hypothetical protein